MDYLAIYHRELQQIHHRRITLVFSAIMVVMLLFALAGYLRTPDRFDDFFRFHAPAMTFVALLMLANHLDHHARHAWLFGFCGYFGTILLLLLLMLYRSDIASPEYVCLIVVMTIYTSIAPLTAGQTLISGLTLISLYLASLVALESLVPSDLPTLYANLFFMLCFVLIAAIQSEAHATAREEECRLRVEEQNAAAELGRQARQLEVAVRLRTKEQQAAEERYRLLYEAIADDILLVAPDGTILQANGSFHQRFLGGQSPPPPSLLHLVADQDRERLRISLLAPIARGEYVSGCQFVLISQDKEQCAMEINGSLLKRADVPFALQLVLRDMRPRHQLEASLAASRNRISQTEGAAILALAKLSEYRDIRPGRHLERIRAYSRLLAEELTARPSWCRIVTPTFLQHLDLGSLLHDIGMVAIADKILFKQESLTGLEEEVLRNHTLCGGDVLTSMKGQNENGSFLTVAANIAYFHHERWDGTGYPYRLQGEAIPAEARIVAVADTYEELTATIAGSAARSHVEAIDQIAADAGVRFDPDVVQAFLVREETFDQLRAALAEEP